MLYHIFITGESLFWTCLKICVADSTIFFGKFEISASSAGGLSEGGKLNSMIADAGGVSTTSSDIIFSQPNSDAFWPAAGKKSSSALRDISGDSENLAGSNVKNSSKHKEELASCGETRSVVIDS